LAIPADSLVVFFFQSLGIRRKKMGCVCFRCQIQARYQQQAFGLLLLVNDVAVAIPGRRKRRRPLLTQKLLQNLFPSELTHDVVFQLRPIRSDILFHGRNHDLWRDFAGLVERRM